MRTSSSKGVHVFRCAARSDRRRALFLHPEHPDQSGQKKRGDGNHSAVDCTLPERHGNWETGSPARNCAGINLSKRALRTSTISCAVLSTTRRSHTLRIKRDRLGTCWRQLGFMAAQRSAFQRLIFLRAQKRIASRQFPAYQGAHCFVGPLTPMTFVIDSTCKRSFWVIRMRVRNRRSQP